MQAITIVRIGPPSVLQLLESPDPGPASGAAWAHDLLEIRQNRGKVLLVPNRS